MNNSRRENKERICLTGATVCEYATRFFIKATNYSVSDAHNTSSVGQFSASNLYSYVGRANDQWAGHLPEAMNTDTTRRADAFFSVRSNFRRPK